MKRHILFIIFAVVVAASADLSAQSSSSPRVDPALTARLREDLTTAIANASLGEDQLRTLRAASETLRAASDARQAGKSVDRGEVKKAFADIKTVLDSDALRPEDAKRVKDDMEAIQQAMREQMKRKFPRRRPAAVA